MNPARVTYCLGPTIALLLILALREGGVDRRQRGALHVAALHRNAAQSNLGTFKVLSCILGLQPPFITAFGMSHPMSLMTASPVEVGGKL